MTKFQDMSVDELKAQEEKLNQKIKKLQIQKQNFRKKQEKERTHLMCQMAGYVLTDILGYKDENYCNWANIKLEDWQEFCNKYKTQIISSLDKKQPTEPNAHSVVDLAQNLTPNKERTDYGF